MLPSTASFSPAPCVEYFCVKNLFPCLGFGWFSGFPKKTFPQNLPKTYLWFGGFPKNCSPQNLPKTYLWFGGFPKQIPKLILYIIYTTMCGWPQKFLKGTPNMPNLIFGPRTDPCVYIYIYLQSKIQNHCSKFKIVRSIKF